MVDAPDISASATVRSFFVRFRSDGRLGEWALRYRRDNFKVLCACKQSAGDFSEQYDRHAWMAYTLARNASVGAFPILIFKSRPYS